MTVLTSLMPSIGLLGHPDDSFDGLWHNIPPHHHVERPPCGWCAWGCAWGAPPSASSPLSDSCAQYSVIMSALLSVVAATALVSPLHHHATTPLPRRATALVSPLRRRTMKTPRCASPRCVYLEGMPSTPGWEDDALNRLTEWAVADQVNRPIICEYKADSTWLWTKWRGTVLQMTYKPILLTMGVGLAIDYLIYKSSTATWSFISVPPADDPLIQQLLGLNSLWEYQLTLATFVLTFFTSQAYAHYRLIYTTTRAIQGRINDICLLLAIGAARADEVDGSSGPVAADATGYSEEAAALVARCTRLIRLSHTFFWAATPTCSNGVGDGGVEDGDGQADLPRNERRGDAIGPLLLSTDGLIELVSAGELDREEAAALEASNLPPSQYTYILLEWVGLHAARGMRNGTLRASNGFEENLLRQLTGLRAEYFNIGDYTAGRMPLAYVQLVQVRCLRMPSDAFGCLRMASDGLGWPGLLRLPSDAARASVGLPASLAVRCSECSLTHLPAGAAGACAAQIAA